MNHKAIVEHESERMYRHRSYCLGKLDERVFDALNEGGHVVHLNGHCIDALDDIPCGSMCSGGQWPAQNIVTRGITHAEQIEQDLLVERLISEILAEEVQMLALN
jgi:hypothetical protein